MFEQLLEAVPEKHQRELLSNWYILDQVQQQYTLKPGKSKYPDLGKSAR